METGSTTGSNTEGENSTWPDRVAGLGLILIACLVLVSAYGFHIPYQYEPLGPRVFPYFVGALLAVVGFLLMFRPHPLQLTPRRHQFVLLGLMLFYAASFEAVGFLLSTFLVLTCVARLVGRRWRVAILGAALVSCLSYLLLVQALGLGLPFGSLWGEPWTF